MKLIPLVPYGIQKSVRLVSVYLNDSVSFLREALGPETEL